MIDLTKLLPSNLRTVQRYKDIVSVYQSYLYNDVKNAIDSFKTRFYPDQISEADIILTIEDFGHMLSRSPGYTETHRYLIRQYDTLIKRLKSKGTEKSYEYLFYVYDVMGDVYPLLRQLDDTLTPWLTWLVSDDVDDPPFMLDDGHTLDEPTGRNPYWTLDSGAIISNTTRHFLISILPRFVENDVFEFISTNTMSALRNDVNQNKRKVEIPHYEIRLYAEANIAGITVSREWKDHDDTISTNQQSVRTSASLSDFSGATYIQFGDGEYSTVNNSITGVNSLIQQLPLTDFDVKVQTSLQLNFRNLITTTFKWFDYREISIHDSSGNCIFYSSFPWIRYASDTLSSGYWLLTLTI